MCLIRDIKYFFHSLRNALDSSSHRDDILVDRNMYLFSCPLGTKYYQITRLKCLSENKPYKYSSSTPKPCLKTENSPLVQSTTVDASLLP